MNGEKPLEFHGTAGGYFVLIVLSIVLIYIPFFGWAFLLNYTASWFAGNSRVNGKAIAYQAGYGESLRFMSLNTLLLIITLGIYSFWYVPKMYRYIASHTVYLDEVVPSPDSAPVDTTAAPTPPDLPTVSQPPVDPTPPAPTGLVSG